MKFITNSIARSAKRRYISYSNADFEVFLPAGATRCTDGSEIWYGGVDLVKNFTVIAAMITDPKN